MEKETLDVIKSHLKSVSEETEKTVKIQEERKNKILAAYFQGWKDSLDCVLRILEKEAK